MVSEQTYGSRLYDTLKAMGVTRTEDSIIREVRSALGEGDAEEIALSWDDVDRISYAAPHFRIPTQDPKFLELWMNGEALNPAEIKWIEADGFLYGVLPENRPMSDRIRVLRNPHIFQRYSAVEEEERERVHTETFSLAEAPMAGVERPEACAWCIADGSYVKPEVSKTASAITFRCAYRKSIDMAFCANLVGSFHAKANEGVFVDNPYHGKSYWRMAVDQDPVYSIDTRFYPCVRIDRDGFLRIYNDQSGLVPHPEISRIVTYPEYVSTEDPYADPNLSAMPICDTEITEEDDVETILEKLRSLAPYFLRAWELIPKFPDEQADFVLCDNFDFGDPSFSRETVIRTGGSRTEAIVSVVPFEPHRDILFLDGEMFGDYEAIRLKRIGSNLVESNAGEFRYVIPGNLDPDRFTLIKFNAGRDTVLENVSETLEPGNLLRLHRRLNRFYRNLLILRGEILDQRPEELVHVSYTEPQKRDSALWFELLVGTDPYSFRSAPVETILAHGLNPDDVPEDIRVGTYSLDLDGTEGQSSYNGFFQTYFDLEEKHRNYLVLHAVEPLSRSDTTLVDDLLNPDFGFILEPISLVNTSTGRLVDSSRISEMSMDEKKALVLEYADVENNEIRELWNRYLESMDEGLLNLALGKILTMDTVYAAAGRDRTSISPVVTGSMANTARKQNVSNVIRRDEAAAEIGDYWIDVPDVSLQDYVGDILYDVIYELGYERIDPVAGDDADGLRHGTLAFDYADEFSSENHIEPSDPMPILQGSSYPGTPENGSLWYEFLDEVSDRICLFDRESLILRMDERLVTVRFDHDNVTVFAFDDVVLNYRSKRSVRYLSVLADLINSGAISRDSINVFHKRLITGEDQLDPGLERLYTGTDHVVMTAKLDPFADCSITYSANIRRLQVDYVSGDVSNREREAAWRMVLDFTKRDIAFIGDRMILFVNGRLVRRGSYEEIAPGKIRLLDFPEIIRCADVLYSERDHDLGRAKRIAMEATDTWVDASESVQRPERDYGKMTPIRFTGKTMRGYYDTLLEDFIFNGKLLANLESPDDAEMIIRDMKRYFRSITDAGLCGMEDSQSRIVIPCFSGANSPYQIGAIQ